MRISFEMVEYLLHSVSLKLNIFILYEILDIQPKNLCYSKTVSLDKKVNNMKIS